MQRILITGASRGLGLEFTRQYLERGEQVFACCRNPETAAPLRNLQSTYESRLVLVRLDVTDAESIRDSCSKVRSLTGHLDVLINNAGIYSSLGSADPSERLGTLKFEEALLVLRTNAVAPLLVAQEYLDLLKGGNNAKLVSLTSGYGSVSANTGGFPYYYSASKAALNMSMRSLAGDLKRWRITSIVLNPGWVRTDMGGPAAPTKPEESVAGMIRVIDSLTPRQNGRLFTWQGHEEPW